MNFVDGYEIGTLIATLKNTRTILRRIPIDLSAQLALIRKLELLELGRYFGNNLHNQHTLTEQISIVREHYCETYIMLDLLKALFANAKKPTWRHRFIYHDWVGLFNNYTPEQCAPSTLGFWVEHVDPFNFCLEDLLFDGLKNYTSNGFALDNTETIE